MGVPKQVSIAMQFVHMIRNTRAMGVCGAELHVFEMTPAERCAYDAAMDLMEAYFLNKLVGDKVAGQQGQVMAGLINPNKPTIDSPPPGDAGGATANLEPNVGGGGGSAIAPAGGALPGQHEPGHAGHFAPTSQVVS